MIEQKYPEPVVGALIVNQEGKIFLMKSPKWKGKYIIPGGHIESGETIEQAIRREVKEETGLDIYDIEFLMLQEFIFGKDFHKKKHFIFLDHVCKTKSKDVVLDGREGVEHIWAGIDEALKFDVEPYTMNTILEYKKRY